MPREQYVVDIVIAVAAKGLSELGVVVAVRAIAPKRLVLLAFAVSYVSRMAAPCGCENFLSRE